MFSTFRDNSRTIFEDFLLIAENIDNRILGDLLFSGRVHKGRYFEATLGWTQLAKKLSCLRKKSNRKKNSLRIAFSTPGPKPPYVLKVGSYSDRRRLKNLLS